MNTNIITKGLELLTGVKQNNDITLIDTNMLNCNSLEIIENTSITDILNTPLLNKVAIIRTDKALCLYKFENTNRHFAMIHRYNNIIKVTCGEITEKEFIKSKIIYHLNNSIKVIREDNMPPIGENDDILINYTYLCGLILQADMATSEYTVVDGFNYIKLNKLR